MPHRAINTLWFNLPGIVAAYQPVSAPNPLLARYNQAHGGDNRYKAVDGVAPSWASATGWGTDGTQWLNTQVIVQPSWSAIIRFSGESAANDTFIFGVSGYSSYFEMAPNSYSNIYYRNGSTSRSNAAEVTAGVFALSDLGVGYRNGIVDTTASGTAFVVASTPRSCYLFCRNNNGSANGLSPSGTKIQSFAIYGRILSAAEFWQASRQMAYCDVNPDWSAWGRRRRWYYTLFSGDVVVAGAPATAGATALAPVVTSSNDATVTAVAATAAATAPDPGLLISSNVAAHPARALAWMEYTAATVAAAIGAVNADAPAAGGTPGVTGGAGVAVIGALGTAAAAMNAPAVTAVITRPGRLAVSDSAVHAAAASDAAVGAAAASDSDYPTP